MTTIQIHDELADFLRIPGSVQQRSELAWHDLNAVDDIGDSLFDVWRLIREELKGRPVQRSALQSLMTLRVVEQRTWAMIDAGLMDIDAAAAAHQVLSEVRMALVGLLDD